MSTSTSNDEVALPEDLGSFLGGPPESIDEATEQEPGTLQTCPTPPCVVAINEPLELAPGETVPLEPRNLCLTGPAPHLIDLMILSPVEQGVLLRDGFAMTGGDVFTQEDINTGKIHYRHEGTSSGADGFLFATPDGEIQPTSVGIRILSVHHAPELLGGGQLAGILAGCRVADILAGQARSPHEQSPGLAIVSLAGRGNWLFSCDDRQTWQEVSALSPARALLLGPGDFLRFVGKAGWAGTIKLTYRVWDRSQGLAGESVDLATRLAVGGTTAFSRDCASASSVLTPVLPIMPLLAPWEGSLTIEELFAGGLAIVRGEGEGIWQYSSDDGRSWLDLGTVYHGRARLLRPSDRVRFLARTRGSGKVILAGRAWDGLSNTTGESVNLASRTSYGENTPFGEFVLTRTWRLGG